MADPKNEKIAAQIRSVEDATRAGEAYKVFVKNYDDYIKGLAANGALDPKNVPSESDYVNAKMNGWYKTQASALDPLVLRK
jgi:hypothetical protein